MLEEIITEAMIIFIVVGFIAQMIDGSIGMAYGVSSTSFLLGLGIPPAPAIASVKTAEMFTSGVSGLSHLKLGNVDKNLFKKLLIPGIIGAFLGAYILVMVPGDTLRPFIAFYLLIMGFVILMNAFQKIREREVRTKLFPLGLAGGFFDALGGGGWGPIVTTTLVARGNTPRFTVGSVNLSEWFVTVTQVVVFIATIGLVHWQIIIGLMIGGVIAAPLAAHVCKWLPTRALMIIIGVVITSLSIRTLYLALV